MGGAQMLAAMQVEASLGRYKLGCELGLRWQLENMSSKRGDSGCQGTGRGEPTSRKEASQCDLSAAEGLGAEHCITGGLVCCVLRLHAPNTILWFGDSKQASCLRCAGSF